MINGILLTGATGKNIGQVMFWGGLLLTSFLVVRASWDFVGAINEPENGLKEAFRKTKKRVFAAIIALTIESTIAFIQSFYK